MELTDKAILITGASGGIGAAVARRLAQKGMAVALAGRKIEALDAVANDCRSLGGEAEVFAASNSCPHKGGPLSEGIVHGQKITCPLHNWVFDLNTGEAVGEDARIATYPVRLDGERILLDATAVDNRSAA